jgi:uncharacterized protein (TIGR02300 family)
MSTKAQRGTKRTCQNPECGSRFYDLNRDSVVCPICETVYQLAMSANAAAPAAEEKAARKPVKKPAFVPAEAVKDAPEGEAEDLVVIEGEEEETAAAEDDETFLEEEEEDGSDVSGIIGGPVEDKDEAT